MSNEEGRRETFTAVEKEGTDHACSLAAEVYDRFLGLRLATNPTRKPSRRAYCIQVLLIIFSVSTQKSAVSRLPVLFCFCASSPALPYFPAGRSPSR
jgi:hypothetical protein